MVVAAARGAAGEVVVGALVSILLVPVVGLVQVAMLLPLLVADGGSSAATAGGGTATAGVGGAALLLIVVKTLCQKLFLHQIRKPFCASD